MPTYEYACSACDATHEVRQKMTDDALTECPVCGASGLRKVFSGVGVHFKGSGFYRTDSRKADSTASSGSSSGSTTSPSTTSTSTTSTSTTSASTTSTSSSGSSSS